MIFPTFCRKTPRRPCVYSSLAIVGFLASIAAVVFALCCSGSEAALSAKEKRIVGATARVTEKTSGASFPARVDTGAKSCSLHVERIIIKDKTSKRVRNVGKQVRFEVKDEAGKLHWIEGEVAAAVRVKSPSLKGGEYDHRYKVKLTLTCNGFSKEVLVTLNDRTDMEFPMLIGRNYLSGNFLVDVEKDDKDTGEEEE